MRKIIKYCIQTQYIDGEITIYEFQRETEYFLFCKNGTKTAKNSSHVEYFDTPNDAKLRIVELQMERVEQAHATYRYEKNKLNELLEEGEE